MWLLLTITSYLLQAINGAIDRVIVHKNKTSPEVVSFWISLFSLSTASLLIIGFLPFDWADNFRYQAPGLDLLVLLLLGGLMIQLGLLYMYKALDDGEATRVLSIMGAVTPIVALIYGYLTIGETLSENSIYAFLLLILGAVALTFTKSTDNNKEWVYYAVVSSVLLGIQSIFAKYAYDNHHFITSYALMSVGGVVFAGYLYTKKFVRLELSNKSKPNQKSSLPLIIFNTIVGGLAVILFNLSIKLGSPSLVNALRGVQYAFIFVIALSLSSRFPMLLDEDLSKKTMIYKISGIILIISGIVILAL